MVGRKSKLNRNEACHGVPCLVSSPDPSPAPEKRARARKGLRLCHASATPQLLIYGRTMGRGALVFVLQGTKGLVRLQWNAVCSGVIPAHFRIIVRDPLIR